MVLISIVTKYIVRWTNLAVGITFSIDPWFVE